jgi:hypothetical protein
MSDFSTYEAEVIVTMRVSAYDKENAIEVAKELLLADNTIVSVSEISKNKELISKLEENYSRSLAIYESLELKTFDSDYSESMEDTVERLYQQGYSDALLMAIKLLEKGAK